jgi:hypothetical protein
MLKTVRTAARFLPFAVMHFIGSGAFSRALRYWARSSPVAAAEAARHDSRADGFKLSDYGLVPIQRKEAVRRGTTYQNAEARPVLQSSRPPLLEYYYPFCTRIRPWE